MRFPIGFRHESYNISYRSQGQGQVANRGHWRAEQQKEKKAVRPGPRHCGRTCACATATAKTDKPQNYINRQASKPEATTCTRTSLGRRSTRLRRGAMTPARHRPSTGLYAPEDCKVVPFARERARASTRAGWHSASEQG